MVVIVAVIVGLPIFADMLRCCDAVMLWKTCGCQGRTSWNPAFRAARGKWPPKSINVAAPFRIFFHQVQVQVIRPSLRTNVAARHAATSCPSPASRPPPAPGLARPTAATRITGTAASLMPGSSSSLHCPLICSVCRPGSRLSDVPSPPVARRKQSLHSRGSHVDLTPKNR